jgi:hypothetical protein
MRCERVPKNPVRAGSSGREEVARRSNGYPSRQSRFLLPETCERFCPLVDSVPPDRPARSEAARDEAAFLFGVLWRAGGSGHRSGSERQARQQEGRGAVEARLFFRHGHAESSCTPE